MYIEVEIVALPRPPATGPLPGKNMFRATQKSIVLTFGRVWGKNSVFNTSKKAHCPSEKGIRVK